MTKITTFDKKTLRALQPKLEQALNDALAEFGLTAKFGGGSFDNSTYKPKVEIIAAGANPEKEDFELYASLYNLKPEDYGKEFNSNGATYTLTGLNPRRPKYPISARRQDGKRFKFTDRVLDQVRAPS